MGYKMGNTNKNLNRSKEVKNDEFYTQFADIEKEMKYYDPAIFKDKVIYCPADVAKPNARIPISEFVNYFKQNAERLKFKKLIATCLEDKVDNDSNLYNKYELISENGGGDTCKYVEHFSHLSDDPMYDVGYGYSSGDYRSKECTSILENCDMVITNPPFSLFRDFMDWIFKYDKQCLVLGSTLAATYKNVFSYIKENRLWLHGDSKNQHMGFITPEGNSYTKKEVVTAWFTNLPSVKCINKLVLTETYYDEFGRPYPDVDKTYPRFDNYDAISVSSVKAIPKDYKGVMGVPSTFMYYYDPNKWELISTTDFVKTSDGEGKITLLYDEVFKKVIIKRKE